MNPLQQTIKPLWEDCSCDIKQPNRCLGVKCNVDNQCYDTAVCRNGFCVDPSLEGKGVWDGYNCTTAASARCGRCPDTICRIPKMGDNADLAYPCLFNCNRVEG